MGMKNRFQEAIQNVQRQRHLARRSVAMVLVLAMLTAMSVSWRLHQDGIALAADDTRYYCGKEEHKHTDDCYIEGTEPICGYEEGEIVEETMDSADGAGDGDSSAADWDEAGSEPESEPATQEEPEPEVVLHHHTADCYEEEEVLTCGIESDHVHQDYCYDQETGELLCTEHEHTDDCYTLEKVLVCGQEEGEPEKTDDGAALYDMDENSAEESDSAEEPETVADPEPEQEATKPETDDELDALRREMDAMQESLNADAAQVEADAGCPNEPIDIDDVVRDAENAARQAEPLSGAPGMVVISRYPAAGLREVNVSLDSDDVTIKAADGTDVLVEWEAGREGVERPTVTMEEHALNVRRANPDVFKTFFSVFQKEGGKVTVRVPRGYAADYVLGTTSGDIRLYAIDVDKVKVNTTSGDVRVEPDAGIRAKEIDVTTISGSATVSACAGDVVVNTVSGRQFVSCDANRADLSVVSGRIHAEGASEEWEINSVSGDIEVLCTVAPTRKMQFNSMSANAHVALPGDIRGFVADISGMSGKVVNEFGPNRYGTCALPIHMDTMSGKLMITRL